MPAHLSLRIILHFALAMQPFVSSLIGGWGQTFFIKGQRVSILGFVGYKQPRLHIFFIFIVL